MSTRESKSLPPEEERSAVTTFFVVIHCTWSCWSLNWPFSLPKISIFCTKRSLYSGLLLWLTSDNSTSRSINQYFSKYWGDKSMGRLPSQGFGTVHLVPPKSLPMSFSVTHWRRERMQMQCIPHVSWKVNIGRFMGVENRGGPGADISPKKFTFHLPRKLFLITFFRKKLIHPPNFMTICISQPSQTEEG